MAPLATIYLASASTEAGLKASKPDAAFAEVMPGSIADVIGKMVCGDK